MAHPLRILIADDDRDFAEVLADYVRELGYEVVAVITGGGLEVIRRYGQYTPDAVLLDIMMPRFNGFTVCHALLSRDPGAKIVFVSGKVDGSHPFVARAGAIDCLEKPIQRQQLQNVLEEIEAQLGAALVS